MYRYVSYDGIKNIAFLGYKVVESNPNSFLMASGAFIIGSGVMVSSAYPIFSALTVLGSIIGTVVGGIMDAIDCRELDGLSTGIVTGAAIGMSVATIVTIFTPPIAGLLILGTEGALTGAGLGYLFGDNILICATSGGVIGAVLGNAFGSAYYESITDMIETVSDEANTMAIEISIRANHALSAIRIGIAGGNNDIDNVEEVIN